MRNPGGEARKPGLEKSSSPGTRQSAAFGRALHRLRCASQGAARCSPCANRSRKRSGRFQGKPLYPPRYAVIELATGACHGSYDSMAEAALCLAFSKLSRDGVEVIVDGPEITRYAAWE